MTTQSRRTRMINMLQKAGQAKNVRGYTNAQLAERLDYSNVSGVRAAITDLRHAGFNIRHRVTRDGLFAYYIPQNA